MEKNSYNLEKLLEESIRLDSRKERRFVEYSLDEQGFLLKEEYKFTDKPALADHPKEFTAFVSNQDITYALDDVNFRYVTTFSQEKVKYLESLGLNIINSGHPSYSAWLFPGEKPLNLKWKEIILEKLKEDSEAISEECLKCAKERNLKPLSEEVMGYAKEIDYAGTTFLRKCDEDGYFLRMSVYPYYWVYLLTEKGKALRSRETFLKDLAPEITGYFDFDGETIIFSTSNGKTYSVDGYAYDIAKKELILGGYVWKYMPYPFNRSRGWLNELKRFRKFYEELHYNEE